MIDTSTSEQLFSRALQVLAGGVNSPVRAFGSVGGSPLFFERGQGPRLVDVDGNQFVDYVLSWGALILGHAHPAVLRALVETAERGTSFGAPCRPEIELAEGIRAAVPSVEVVRMVNSGTEAVMSALRLARAFTDKPKIVKFAGCYHGHADLLLVQAGSGVATLGLPDSPGVPIGAVRDTVLARYNDLESVQRLFEEHPDQIAAVIVEPVAGNMGMVQPATGFLEGLRTLTSHHRALLIFDEVMTGFRVGPGGAQSLFGISPDLTTLGKVIGGGLPVGAFGGRREIMDMVAPTGPVYQAGTLSGNPLSMAAGLTTLRELEQPRVWEGLHSTALDTVGVLADEAKRAGVPLQVGSVGAMFGFFFSDRPVTHWDEAQACDRDLFRRFFRAMLEEGVYLAPSPFEAGFVSTAHGEQELDALGHAARSAFASIV